MADKRKAISFFDYSLVIMVMFIAGVGLVMMYSASGYSAQNQVFACPNHHERVCGIYSRNAAAGAGPDDCLWSSSAGAASAQNDAVYHCPGDQFGSLYG